MQKKQTIVGTGTSTINGIRVGFVNDPRLVLKIQDCSFNCILNTGVARSHQQSILHVQA